MTTIRDLWCMVRAHGSRFAPRGAAPREPTGAPQRCPTAAAHDEVTGVDPQASPIPQPDLALLQAEGEKLLQEARALGRTPALAVVQIDDLPELELVFGRPGVDRVVQALVAGLARAAAGHGLVVRTAADTFALMMPGGGAGAAIAALQARFGKPCTIEIGFGRDEILVVPDVLVHPLGPQDSVAQVYAALCRHLAKARTHARGHRSGAPRRAARPGTAIGGGAVAGIDARPAPSCPPLPPTIPMPLGAR